MQEFVDVYGTVVRLFADALQRSGSLAKKEIAIVSGVFEVVLELLGPKASYKIRDGDIIAVNASCLRLF